MPEVIINSSGGRLEGRYHINQKKDSPFVLILHQHPQYGGSINHEIIQTLYRSFVKYNFHVLSFNFRGIGRSEGVFSNGECEFNDVAATFDWIQSVMPHVSNFWVVGFSFGSWIGMQLLMRRPEITGFISISPPVNLYDFNFLAPCPISGQIIQGKNDTIVPQPSVEALVQKLNNQKRGIIEYKLIEDADHFFSGCLDKLSYSVEDYIERRFNLKTIK